MKFNPKNNVYSSISKKDFRIATQNLNKKEKALAKAYYKAVNSKETHYVDIVLSNNDNFSDFTLKHEPLLKKGIHIEGLGGGVNIEFPGGNGDTLTLLNLFSQTNYGGFNLDGTKNNLPTYMFKEAVMVHEIFGHAIGRNDELNGPVMENIYHDVQKTGVFVDGADHNNGIPLSVEERTTIPKHLQDEK